MVLLTSSSDEGDESAVAESFARCTLEVERRSRLPFESCRDFAEGATRFRCLLVAVLASLGCLIDVSKSCSERIDGFLRVNVQPIGIFTLQQKAHLFLDGVPEAVAPRSGGDGARDRWKGVPGRTPEALSSAESDPTGIVDSTDRKKRSLCAECEGRQRVGAFLGGTRELREALRSSFARPQFDSQATINRFEQDLPAARMAADSGFAAGDDAGIAIQLVGEELGQSETSLEFRQIAAQ